MMAKWMMQLAAIVMAAGAVGCGASKPARFYTLQPTATAVDAPPAGYAVLVGPVSVPPAVDRPQFVVQVTANRVEIDEFNRWAAPLNDIIARTVAADLATLLGTRDVAAAPLASFPAAYRVTINVQRFDTVQGDAALLDAVWTINRTADGNTRSGHTVARQALQREDLDDVAAAHSRALATLSADIAAEIRSAAASPVPVVTSPREGGKKK
jgi:uncharacterized protein